jgi:ATP-dependent exoDNAse (exonuclease V) beta subunit
LTCATRGWQKAEAREQEREAAEERRLWYVAATRVRDHLVIPAPLVEAGVDAERRVFANENLRNVLSNGEDEGKGVFVFRNSLSLFEQALPKFTAPVLTAAELNSMAVRAYQEWDAQRRATLVRGRK